MNFELPPGYEQLPPEIQSSIRREMVQQYIMSLHVSGEILDAINKIAVSVNTITTDPKYKDNSDIQGLDKDVNSILDHVKRTIEQYNVQFLE